MSICIVVPQFQGRIIDAPSYNMEVLYQSPCKKFIMKLDYQDQKEVKLKLNTGYEAIKYRWCHGLEPVSDWNKI